MRALLDVLGPQGTLMAYASWADHVYRAEDWPAEHRDAYLADPPVFDIATAEVDRGYGRVPERVRTWPGAQRSANPEASVVAVGARAAWLCRTQPDDDAYGAQSPFGRLVESGGQVLMLGAPLETITLLHHAEAIARVARKRRVTFDVLVAEDGEVVKRTYTDIDTSDPGALPYEELGHDEDGFAIVGRAALAAGAGVRGRVGEGDCHLLRGRRANPVRRCLDAAALRRGVRVRRRARSAARDDRAARRSPARCAGPSGQTTRRRARPC